MVNKTIINANASALRIKASHDYKVEKTEMERKQKEAKAYQLTFIKAQQATNELGLRVL